MKIAYKRISNTLLLIGCFFLCFFATTLKADSNDIIPKYDVKYYENRINYLYAQLATQSPLNELDKLMIISNYFLDQPYLLGALGEGPLGHFDRNPLYRTDGFDCVTYVSTVLALTKSSNLASFIQHLKQIQYINGIVEYQYRNHFTGLDWNINNSKKGYVTDITKQIVDEKGMPIYQYAKAYIDKKNWYLKKDASSIKYFTQLSSSNTQNLVNQLHALSDQVSNAENIMPYLPLSRLFDAQKNPNLFLFNQIPSGSIIEIIRPNWDLEKIIGTNLNVSHLGFAIRTDHGLMFRHASSIANKVIDIPLDQYLSNYLDSSTIKGINIQKIIWNKP